MKERQEIHESLLAKAETDGVYELQVPLTFRAIIVLFLFPFLYRVE